MMRMFIVIESLERNYIIIETNCSKFCTVRQQALFNIFKNPLLGRILSGVILSKSCLS